MTEQQVTLRVIEVIPDQGVYYDNKEGYNPKKYQGEGYAYYYFDEDGDGQATTIYLVDASGEVKGIGFDYDGNAYFEPFKTIPTEEHIIKSVPTISEGTIDILLEFVGNEYIDYQTEDAHDGLFMQPTFRDSLFDIWKSQYDIGSTILINQIKKLTSDQFIASLTFTKVAGDIVFQVTAQVAAFVGGKIGAAALSWIPGIGTAIGFAAGYFITYVVMNAINANEKAKEMSNYLGVYLA